MLETVIYTTFLIVMGTFQSSFILWITVCLRDIEVAWIDQSVDLLIRRGGGEGGGGYRS